MTRAAGWKSPAVSTTPGANFCRWTCLRAVPWSGWGIPTPALGCRIARGVKPVIDLDTVDTGGILHTGAAHARQQQVMVVATGAISGIISKQGRHCRKARSVGRVEGSSQAANIVSRKIGEAVLAVDEIP